MEKPSLIWRLENSKGLGAYTAGAANREDNKGSYYGRSHPTPTWKMVTDRHFGCPSVSALRRWFRSVTDVRSWADEFMLTVYQSDDVMHSKGQCSFNKEKAKLILSLPSSALYDLSVEELKDQVNSRLGI